MSYNPSWSYHIFLCGWREETIVTAITLGVIAERKLSHGVAGPNRSLSISHTRGSWGLLSMGSVILTCCTLGTLRMFTKHYCQNPTTPGLSGLTEGVYLSLGREYGACEHVCMCQKPTSGVFTGTIHLAFLSSSLFLFALGRVSLGPGSHQSG